MKRNKFICILAGILCWGLAYSQTIDQLVQTVFEQNLELKAIELEYQAASERSGQIKRIPDTEISVGVFALPVETRVGAQFLRLSGMQAFPQNKVLDQKESLASSKANLVLQRLNIKKLQLNYQVRKAALSWYRFDRTQSIIQENIRILQSQEQIALSKVETGKASAADVIQIQIKIKALEKELTILENQKDLPVIQIAKLLPRAESFTLNINEDLSFTNLAYDLDSIEHYLVQQHPQIQFLNLQQEVSRQAQLLNQIDQKPTFGAGLDYIMVNKRDLAVENHGQDIIQLKAAVKIPIYKKHYAAKDREEKLLSEAIEIQKENTVDQFMANIRYAYNQHESSRLKKELYEEQIKLTKTAIDILQTNYSAKGNRFDELINLINELNNYELKLLQVIVESHLQKLEIDQLLFPAS